MASNWLTLGATEDPNPKSKSRSSATAKTPYDKMLINFDEQLAMFKGGRKPESKMGQAKQWFKLRDDGVTEIRVRFAGAPVALFEDKDAEDGYSEVFYVPNKKDVPAVAKGIRGDLEARAFADRFKPLEDKLQATLSQRSATRSARKK